METSDANQRNKANDPEWQFLAEFPLNELLSDREKGFDRTVELMLQTMRESGMLLDCHGYINLTLKEFIKKAQAHIEQGSFGWSGRMRLFCQKKLFEDANSAKNSRLSIAEPASEYRQGDDLLGAKMDGGWGYYVIERGRDPARAPGEEACRVTELYFYKEGQ